MKGQGSTLEPPNVAPGRLSSGSRVVPSSTDLADVVRLRAGHDQSNTTEERTRMPAASDHQANAATVQPSFD